MSQPQAQGMVGALIGSMGGGFAWLVMTGFVIGSPIVSVLAIVIGVVGFIGGMKIVQACPERRLTIVGLGLIWIALFNVVFVNHVYERIPETVGGMTTGKHVLDALSLTVIVAAIGLVGFGIVMRDLLHQRSST